MSSGHMWLESGQMKVADLQREAREHRLARSFRPRRPPIAAVGVLADVWVAILGGVLFLLAH